MSRTFFRMSLVLCAAVALASPAALADDGAACWYRDLERSDFVTHPPQGGDNDFFTRADVPPNLLWVLDNSGSMQTLPCNGDCDDFTACEGGFHTYGKTFFTSRGYKGYTNDSNAYDAYDPDFCAPKVARGFNGNDGCYRPGLVYRHFDASSNICTSLPSGSGQIWTRDASSDNAATIANWCASEYPRETPPSPTSSPSSCTSDSQCQVAAGYQCLNTSGGTTGSRRCRLPSNCVANSNRCPSGFTCNASSRVCESWAGRDACIEQLSTYGYHPGPNRAHPVFTGDLLNFYPPKFVSARRVLKDLVEQTKKTRQGLMVFDTKASIGNSSDDKGGKLLVDFNPECNMFFPVKDSNYSNNRSSIKNEIDKVKFLGGTPLGETLTSACQYVSGDANRFKNDVMVRASKGVGASDSDIPNKKNNQDTVCVSCQKNVVVVITDGSPSKDTNVPCKLQNYDRDCKEGLQSSPLCGSVNTSTCPTSQRRTYTQSGGTDYFDDVAMFCFEEDLRPDMPDKQNAIIHTVGFDSRAPILEDAARQGGGLYYHASDATELRSALTKIVAEVNRRATSFSVASVTTVQTRGSTYAFVPRFRPSADKMWEGHLYRFKLFNEFSAGCTLADTIPPMTADKLKRNPNGNGSCDDVYLMDANNDFVMESEDGEYLLSDTTRPWTNDGWPARVPSHPAVEVWDASDELFSRNPASDPRRIYTVVDTNGNGVLEPSEQIEFSEANLANLLAPLGLDNEFCASLATRLYKSYANRTECARDVVRFVRGLDIFDENRNGSTTDMRPKPLGDIFHSSPILVTAPAPSYLCDLGVSSQCVFSLYGPELTPNGEQAYQAYAERLKERDQFVLVGANDGMLHAFHAGAWQDGDDPDTPAVETRRLTLGTGRELWAFVPPDLLPKLKRMLARSGRHELFVDGTAMVRDVWVDSSVNPGEKDDTEFHTLAVVGERQGGRSYFALDVTNPAAPAFRWIYPPPGDTAALEAGESWNDYAPGAPPIGPVAVADAQGPLTVGNKAAREVWSVFLGGGYDPNLLRGRSVSALDVWTGKPLWRFSAYDAAATDPQRELFPVVSPVAMVDIGAGHTTTGRQDGLFDTAVVGDLAGQVWTLRFHEPGVDADGDGLMDNWFGARSFVQFRGEPYARRSPFFQLPEVAVAPETGRARVYLGSGDRAHIRAQNNAQCGLANLAACDCGLANLGACVRKGCKVEVGGTGAGGTSHFRRGLLQSSGKWTHQSPATALSSNAVSRDSLGALSATCDETLEAQHTVKLTCGSSSATFDWGASCDLRADGEGGCSAETPKPEISNALVSVVADTENARFYAFDIFGGHVDRGPFSSPEEARRYDAAALSDASLGNVSTGQATPLGYYVPFGETDERAASAATVFGGCVVWNTLEPDESTGVTACGGKVADRGRTYIAHYGDGGTACGSLPTTTPRFTTRKSIVPPPPPTPVVSLNPESGEVRYGLVAVEPGLAPSQSTVGGGDVAGPIYWLEVSRELHQCRHGEGVCE